jgi:hypothetical protein
MTCPICFRAAHPSFGAGGSYKGSLTFLSQFSFASNSDQKKKKKKIAALLHVMMTLCINNYCTKMDQYSIFMGHRKRVS